MRLPATRAPIAPSCSLTAERWLLAVRLNVAIDDSVREQLKSGAVVSAGDAAMLTLHASALEAGLRRPSGGGTYTRDEVKDILASADSPAIYAMERRFAAEIFRW